MNKKTNRSFALSVAATAFASEAQATLTNNGNGLVYVASHFYSPLAWLMRISLVAGFLISSVANASLVSGNAILTIDNQAVIDSSPDYRWFFQTHWGPGYESTRINGLTAGGTALDQFGVNTMVFPVNTNTTTIVTSTEGYGRTLQATTMDASNTSAGQIGLNGAMRMHDPDLTLTSYLGPYDLSLKKTNDKWIIRTYDTGFKTVPMFDLSNVSEYVDGNGELHLEGDLQWATGFVSWKSVLFASTDIVVGHFSLQPVPLPAGLWLFASALLGLLGMTPQTRK